MKTTEDGVDLEETSSVEFEFGVFSIFLRGDRWELEYFDAEEGQVNELLEDPSTKMEEDYEIFADGSWLMVKVSDLQKCKDTLKDRTS